MVTEELVGVQSKIQIAGSVAKFATRRKCNNSFTYDISMYSEVSGLLKCQLAYVAVFKVKQPQVIKKLVPFSSTGTLNSTKLRYIVKRNSL